MDDAAPFFQARLGVRALPVPIAAAAAAPAARLVFGRKVGHVFKRILKANLKTSMSFNLLEVIKIHGMSTASPLFFFFF